MAPRTEFCCHPVVIISSMLTPLLCFSSFSSVLSFLVGFMVVVVLVMSASGTCSSRN